MWLLRRSIIVAAISIIDLVGGTHRRSARRHSAQADPRLDHTLIVADARVRRGLLTLLVRSLPLR
jgi:hypothetical protein